MRRLAFTALAFGASKTTLSQSFPERPYEATDESDGRYVFVGSELESETDRENLSRVAQSHQNKEKTTSPPLDEIRSDDGSVGSVLDGESALLLPLMSMTSIRADEIPIAPSLAEVEVGLEMSRGIIDQVIPIPVEKDAFFDEVRRLCLQPDLSVRFRRDVRAFEERNNKSHQRVTNTTVAAETSSATSVDSGEYSASSLSGSESASPVSSETTDGLRKTWHELVQNHSCAICFDLLAAPHVLTCGHSFCFHCLQEYRASFVLHNNEDHDGGNSSSASVVHTCPECTREVVLDQAIYELRWHTWIVEQVDAGRFPSEWTAEWDRRRQTFVEHQEQQRMANYRQEQKQRASSADSSVFRTASTSTTSASASASSASPSTSSSWDSYLNFFVMKCAPVAAFVVLILIGISRR